MDLDGPRRLPLEVEYNPDFLWPGSHCRAMCGKGGSRADCLWNKVLNGRGALLVRHAAARAQVLDP